MPDGPGSSPSASIQSLILDQLKSIRQEQQSGFNSVREEFNSRLDRLVTQDAFSAEQRRVNDRLTNLGRDITNEGNARVRAQEASEQRAERTASNIRWLAASIVVPIALFVTNIIMLRGQG